jgi:hypothetical protein
MTARQRAPKADRMIAKFKARRAGVRPGGLDGGAPQDETVEEAYDLHVNADLLMPAAEHTRVVIAASACVPTGAVVTRRRLSGMARNRWAWPLLARASPRAGGSVRGRRAGGCGSRQRRSGA